MSHIIKLGVIGDPIAHSLSDQVHEQFAVQTGLDIKFEKIAQPSQGFAEKLQQLIHEGYQGLSVTIPHKTAALENAEHQSQAAKLCGAANVLKFTDGEIQADNCDGMGLIADLKNKLNLSSLGGKRIAVLGSGGAARGILYALSGEDCALVSLSNRSVGNARKLAEELAPLFPDENLWVSTTLEHSVRNFDVVINASSSSMFNEVPEWIASAVSVADYVVDIFYSKAGETVLTKYAEAKGVKASDGLGMLVHQAEVAFRWWTDLVPDNQLSGQLGSQLDSQAVIQALCNSLGRSI